MSGTLLKIIALISMLVDHIWLFFPNTPVWFHWIGRVSLPIFLYCCVLGYIHTKNRKRYFIRIYCLSLIVGVINYIINVDLNSIRTIFITLIFIYIYDKIKKRDKNGIVFLFLFLIWQFLTSILLLNLLEVLTEQQLFMLATVLGNFLNLNGGLLFALLGFFMYLFYDSKKKFVISFLGVTIIYMILYNSPLLIHIANYLLWNQKVNYIYPIFTSFFNLLFGIHPSGVTNDILFGNPQWMMIGAISIIFLYNGTRGKGLKYLFYFFYPVHIVVLYILSLIL